MKTFSREHWNEAQQAWKDGEFSDEWKPYRHQAAMRGILYPPAGTKFDSWEDDDPSDRAMLIRAIREAPSLLKVSINRAHSWPEVVAYVIRRRDEWKEEMDLRTRDAARHRDTSHVSSDPMSIKEILERIAQS